MGLFGFGSKEKISRLEEEIELQQYRIQQLEDLCDEKDEYFKELMADGLRHGSPLAGKHMSDRKKYLQGE